MTITVDEVSHISVGYYYFKTGRYFLNIEHPPLVKDIGAIPFLFLKPTFPEISSSFVQREKYFVDKYPNYNFVYPKNLEFKNDQLDWSSVFLFNPRNSVDQLVLFSRLAIILANCLVLYLIFYFLSKIWTPKAAWLSLFLISTSQFLIAHGSAGHDGLFVISLANGGDYLLRVIPQAICEGRARLEIFKPYRFIFNPGQSGQILFGGPDPGDVYFRIDICGGHEKKLEKYRKIYRPICFHKFGRSISDFDFLLLAYAKC